MREQTAVGQARHCEELLRRSNPGSLRGDSLDCFTALAMTEYGSTTSFFPLRPRLLILAASSARVLQSSRPPEEGAGKAGRRLAPAIPCAKDTRTGGSQVTPGTSRPSLREWF
ncbi:hypothetical protein EAS61_38330 [Bradyrhizobium zhanjiangense]|uniref:Uncharacterized protein n=1 Tax=Bradyrhizobium zhanjiangense TaxID=1325107 RepID=A0A4Q0Q6V2_9BRAD|nr:hypothetical protein EAS61_38330 [Bradyrhizobium zhanjiangense]